MANISIYAAFERMWQHVVAKLGNKSDITHNHDDLYYTQVQIDTKLESKSDVSHNHDSAYDAKGAAAEALTSAKNYADSAASSAANTVKNDLLNGAGGAYDTLKELGDLINENTDAIDALELVATGKADKTHTHPISEVNELQTTLDRIQDLANIVPDWNQNSESANDYIKNRTHYSVTGLTTLVDETADCSNGDYYFSNSFVIEIGKSYTVIFNGTTYECVGFKDGYYPTIGAPYGDWSNYPFCIYNNSGELAVSPQTNGTYTVKITATAETVYKLDEKYIPDTYVKFDNAVGRAGTGDDAEIFNNYEDNVASGQYSHAEGTDTEASGHASHAEGSYTVASGWISHAEGFSTIAAGGRQHVEGANNIEDTASKYIHIAGNGSLNQVGGNRSNAYTLDWDGNAWFAGNVYVGSTSGTNKDDGSKKLISESDHDWVQIYDSGATTEQINSFANINISGYKKIMMAIKCVNDTTNASTTRYGSAIFKATNGTTYQFPVFNSMFFGSETTTASIGFFEFIDGWIVCPQVVRSIKYSDFLTSTEGGTCTNMNNMGSGLMKCTNPLSTVTISNLDQNADFFFGVGSRVIVWGSVI